MPFLPEQYKYGVIPEVSRQYDTVHRMLYRADIDTVYWAGDAGKEGQTIEENIRRFGGVREGMKELRVWIDSQTEEEILRGIREGLELPPEATVDTLRLSDRQLSQAGYTSLPRTLGEALDAFESSQLMYEALGDHIHSFFLRKKRDEWAKYSAAVTDWEIRHYLGNS